MSSTPAAKERQNPASVALNSAGAAGSRRSSPQAPCSDRDASSPSVMPTALQADPWAKRGQTPFRRFQPSRGRGVAIEKGSDPFLPPNLGLRPLASCRYIAAEAAGNQGAA